MRKWVKENPTETLKGENKMTGLTSVTFRQLAVEDIIDLAVKAGLQGIEWGGDVHVPAGEKELAESVREKTEAAGLRVLSYGSYYRLGKGMEFVPVLESAKALGAPVIRIWGGTFGSANASEEDYLRLSAELRSVCAIAAADGIRIALEYHRNTLTDCKESALKLLNLTGASNLTCYWQPNPELPVEEHLREIEAVLPYFSNVHVFHWSFDGKNVRHPMEEGKEVWKQYLDALSQCGHPFDTIMEFVPDDSPAQFLADAKVLKELVG